MDQPSPFSFKPIGSESRGVFYGMTKNLNTLVQQIGAAIAQDPDIQNSVPNQIVVGGSAKSGKTSLIKQAISNVNKDTPTFLPIFIDLHIKPLTNAIKSAMNPKLIDILYGISKDRLESRGINDPARYLDALLKCNDEEELCIRLNTWILYEEKLKSAIFVFNNTEKISDSQYKWLRENFTGIYIEERRTPLYPNPDIKVTPLEWEEAVASILGKHNDIPTIKRPPAYIESPTEELELCSLFINQTGTLVGFLQRVLCEWDKHVFSQNTKQSEPQDPKMRGFNDWLNLHIKKDGFQSDFREWWNSVPPEDQEMAKLVFSDGLARLCRRITAETCRLHGSSNGKELCEICEELFELGVLFKDRNGEYQIPLLIQRLGKELLEKEPSMPLTQNLTDLLERCDELSSHETLYVFFVDPRIQVWRSGLPGTAALSVQQRVSTLLNYMYDKTHKGESGLVLLLNSLADKYRDDRHERLLNLADELNQGFGPVVIPPKERPEMERYINFNLQIAANGHLIASSPQGQAMADISTQPPNDIQRYLQLIEERNTSASLLEQVGRSLYTWLFPGAIHTHLHQTEAAARAQGAKLRLRLQIEAPTIASLPLEFIYRAEGGYFFSTNPSTVLSRYLNLPLPPEQVRRREGPLHMLAIIADPTDQTRLNPDEWETIIKDALKKPIEARQMTLQTVKRATRREIRNALLQQKPDIIQFVGHGIYQNGTGYLALVNEAGTTWRVDDGTFASLFTGYNDHLGLISMATCESAQSDDPQGFLGIAPKLVEQGVPAVVAMQYNVYVKTAKVFLDEFYTDVAARKPIDWAVQSARKAVWQEFGLDNREFATPVLYMRAEDGNVF